MSYSEVTLIFKEKEKEEGRKRGQTERNKIQSQKDGCLEGRKKEKKASRGREKTKAERYRMIIILGK